jgi:ATP-dependent DNA helicase RecG
MFASKVEKLIPHTESIFAAFKGTDKTNIYDRNDVKDDLLIQFNEAVAFLKKHLNVRSEIRGFDRFDIYEIPLDALREAVVNAIVHRDYRIKGTSIYVRIFDDRVEIENPGGLPDGITKRDFGKSSVRRNPIIADLFHRMGKVERMGSGIERMRDLMREAGLKEPVFEMDAFFRVTFYRDPRYSLKADRFQKAGKKDGEAGEKTMGITGEKILREVVEKGGVNTEKVRSKYGENAEKIILAIASNQFIKTYEIADKTKLSKSTIEKIVAKLKKAGILKRIGPDKGGYWEIVNG